MGGSHSRRKGQSAEREFAAFLTGIGLDAKRGLGQARGGGGEVPDVICEGLPGVHFEVKRYASPQIHTRQADAWAQQARRDAPAGRLPVLAHRWDGSRVWMLGVCLPGIILWCRAETLLAHLREPDSLRLLLKNVV